MTETGPSAEIGQADLVVVEQNAGLRFSGLTEAQAAPMLARHFENKSFLSPGARFAAAVPAGRKALIVTSGQGVAFAFAKNLRFFWKGGILALPEEDPPFLRAEARSRETASARMAAMDALTRDEPCVVVAPASMAIRRTMSPKEFADSEIVLSRFAQGKIGSFGDAGGGSFGAVGGNPCAGAASADSGGSSKGRHDLDALKRRLAEMGYIRAPYTENPGEFSVRGGILDLFPIQEELPFRIEFFGDEIERIRTYDPETQKTLVAAESVRIAPADEKTQGALCLADWLGARDTLVLLDPEGIDRALSVREREALADFTALLEDGGAEPSEWDSFAKKADYEAMVRRRAPLVVTPYGAPRDSMSQAVFFEAKQPPPLHGQMDLLSAEFKRYLRQGFAVTVACSTQDRREKLQAFAGEEGFGGRIAFVDGELTGGVEITSERLVWLWDGDIFRSEKKLRRKRVRNREKITAFTDIEAGDHVVHERHGIGVYKGIRTIETAGDAKDYLTIAYAGKDVLYIPVEQMDLVQRYIGSGENRPRVSRLGTGEWAKTKARVRREVEEYAGELLRLAAERRVAPGHAFGPDTVWQKEFEDRFPWEPTSDQIRCFEAVKSDMEQPWPMDRLICGDVGYGKTEVALRAVFKCVMDGKQACMLAPTTILAAQHGRTFSDRFADFSANVEVLSRFQTPAKQSEIFRAMSEGKVDVVIGTHMLLSKQVAFKDLGLLVIDEEQRFGVRHKEKIRGLKSGIDVLTLTATPIPRTLHMSLIGMRDMELIEEPPEERYPVQTYVSEERDDIIVECVRRELDRGGQSYVVYNRVDGIERVAERISSLIPVARVGVCHAQMNERMIEDIMLNFYDGAFDVLVSTTIIESGVDIPNVNTILILDADRLGLTQLYQLRGRVGRSNRIAFAYLFYRRDKVLTEVAQKRLRTIREFTEFGSGFKIAMKDLEIRGAGNLLGLSQHGHMASVGYDLYCKLMDDAVAKLRGETGEMDRTDERTEECRIEAAVPAVIPAAYIEDEVVRLQVYKRISLVANEADAEDIFAEMADRFGEIPRSARNLVYIALIRRLAGRLGLTELSFEKTTAVLAWNEAPVNFAKMVFAASEKMHETGGRAEADLRKTPRLRLFFAGGGEKEGLRETVRLLDILCVDCGEIHGKSAHP
jgi:transcription-repair coupling factor (superfamily II helicase)